LSVRWTIADPAAVSLPEPKSLYFDFSIRSRLRGGAVLLVSARETLAIPARKPAVDYIGGGFDAEAVHVEDPATLAKLAGGGPWRFVALDGRGRLRAEGPLNFPDREEAERRFASLKAVLDKQAASPDSACEVVPIMAEPT